MLGRVAKLPITLAATTGATARGRLTSHGKGRCSLSIIYRSGWRCIARAIYELKLQTVSRPGSAMHDGDDEKRAFGKESLAAQAMGRIDAETRAVVPPIHISTTFLRDADNNYTSGFAYGRADNATVRELERVLQMLEGGASALVFGSGMSAALAVFLSLPSGAKVLAPNVMYWALRHWLLTEGSVRHGLQVRFVDMEDLDVIRAAAVEGCDLIWAESPSNPLWGVSDLTALAD